MKLRIDHITRYEYSAPLEYAHQSLCLTPPACAHQTVHEWAVVAPGPLFAQRDGYGNESHTWSLMRRSYGGVVRAHGLVETHGSPWLDAAEGAPALLYLRSTPLTTGNAELGAMARRCLAGGVNERSLLALAGEVTRRLPYTRSLTSVTTTALQALALGGGVCQDHAHVFLAACRSQGVPARYVSGYFYAPDAPHLASHAWVDVHVAGEAPRWLSVDVTHGCLMTERHVRVAVGPDYAACPPIRGVREGGGEERMHVSVDIVDPDSPAPQQPQTLGATQMQTQRQARFQSAVPVSNSRRPESAGVAAS